MEQEDLALKYFSRNEELYTDMSECVLRGAAEIEYAETDGVLLRERSSGIYMFAAEERASGVKILSFLKERALKNYRGWLVAHGDNARSAVYEVLPLQKEVACYQVVYTDKQPRKLKGILEFRYPERAQIEVIKREYHLESPENIEKLCAEKKIWGGFIPSGLPEGGAFVGFIGRHPEGSMGLLQVLPEYRRRGYGEELENFMINTFLREGRVPYGHVIEDNAVSLRLQKKLGYDLADEKIYWLYEC